MNPLVEAYKKGRKTHKWTDRGYILPAESPRGKKQACAFGAIAIGLGGDFPQQVASDVLFGSPTRYFKDVQISYKCDCYSSKDYPAQVIEHYSDRHRKDLGKDENIIAMLEKYGLKRPVSA